MGLEAKQNYKYYVIYATHFVGRRRRVVIPDDQERYVIAL